jgi:transposase
VLGFCNKKNEFYSFETEEKIDSKFVIEAIDTFTERVFRPTVLVVDNAPIHRSKLFMSKIEGWMEKGLYIFYLPKYSPELNKIEILWRFINGATIRYEWIEVKAYLSWENLVENLKQIFNQIGTKYTINFT